MPCVRDLCVNPFHNEGNVSSDACSVACYLLWCTEYYSCSLTDEVLEQVCVERDGACGGSRVQ